MEINDLVLEKQNLIRQLDNKEINLEAYRLKFNEVERQIKEFQQKEVERQSERLVKKQVLINGEKTEVNVPDSLLVKQKRKSSIRGLKEGSNAMLIKNALLVGGNCIDDISKQVVSLNGSLDKLKIENQTKAVIRDIKKGKGHWKDYVLVTEWKIKRVDAQ